MADKKKHLTQIRKLVMFFLGLTILEKFDSAAGLKDKKLDL